MGVDFQPNVQHNDGKNFISGMGKSEMLLPCAGGRLKEASMNSQRKCSSKERDVLTKGKGQQLTRGNEKRGGKDMKKRAKGRKEWQTSPRIHPPKQNTKKFKKTVAFSLEVCYNNEAVLRNPLKHVGS